MLIQPRRRWSYHVAEARDIKTILENGIEVDGVINLMADHEILLRFPRVTQGHVRAAAIEIRCRDVWVPLGFWQLRRLRLMQLS
jgi:hypothetical protein